MSGLGKGHWFQPRCCHHAKTGRPVTIDRHDHALPGFAALHGILSDPKPGATAFQRGHHTEHDFYTWLESRPAGQAAFHRFMETQFAGLPTWLEAVDFASEIGGGRPATETDAMLVDVGGGNGSQCALLRGGWPEMPGRLILQDRHDVVAKALEVPGIEKMSYDFLTEQPVRSTYPRPRRGSPSRRSGQPEREVEQALNSEDERRRQGLLPPTHPTQPRRRHVRGHPAGPDARHGPGQRPRDRREGATRRQAA